MDHIAEAVALLRDAVEPRVGPAIAILEDHLAAHLGVVFTCLQFDELLAELRRGDEHGTELLAELALVLAGSAEERAPYLHAVVIGLMGVPGERAAAALVELRPVFFG